jgi:Adenylate and Guanylate cyclase catalytic domain
MRVGLAVLDAVATLNATVGGGDGTRLAVRIGMHTGLVVIGVMGGRKSEVLALGDTPERRGAGARRSRAPESPYPRKLKSDICRRQLSSSFWG